MKVLTFRQALHIVAFLVAALLAKYTEAQIPDTIYYQQIGIDTVYNYNIDVDSLGQPDSLGIDTVYEPQYVIYQSSVLPTTGINSVEPMDVLMTKEQVADYAFDLIYRNEQANWADAARLMRREKLARLYAPVNNIIRDMYGYGFFVMTRQKHIDKYEGLWTASEAGVRTYFTVNKFGQVVETNAAGVPIEGGRTANMGIYTENRFKITNYFTAITNQEYFNKQFDSDLYVAGNVYLRKLK